MRKVESKTGDARNRIIYAVLLPPLDDCLGVVSPRYPYRARREISFYGWERDEPCWRKVVVRAPLSGQNLGLWEALKGKKRKPIKAKKTKLTYCRPTHT